jgi:hypothetical protein
MRQLQHVRAAGDYLPLPACKLIVEGQEEVKESLGKVLLGIQISRRIIHVWRFGVVRLRYRVIVRFLVQHRDIIAGQEYGVKYLGAWACCTPC